MKEIREFGQKTVQAAEALAAKHCKPTHSIMIAAGLGVEHSRHGDNFANKFKTWYQHKHPKPNDCKFYLNNTLIIQLNDCVVQFPEYQDQIHEAYRDFQAKYPKTNKATYEKACKPIIDYCNSLDNITDESKKNVIAHMNQVKQKFTDLVCFDDLYFLAAVSDVCHDLGYGLLES